MSSTVFNPIARNAIESDYFPVRTFIEILSDKIDADPDLTEAGLATKAGLNNSTIRQMIKNKRSPRIDTAMKICRALNTTLEDFFAENTDPVRSELSFLIDQLSDQERGFLLSAAKGIRAQGRAEDSQAS